MLPHPGACLLAQFVPLHLSGSGLGQLFEKLDPARPLVTRQPPADEIAQFPGQYVAAMFGLLQYHEGAHDRHDDERDAKAGGRLRRHTAD